MNAFPESSLIIRTKQAHLAAVLHRAPGKKLVILCHGYTGNKIENGRLFVQTARAMQKAGLNVLRFDFMGSGDSSGNMSDISPNTQIRDCLDVLAWGQKRYARVGLLGLSFGGATVICAAHAAKKRPVAMVTWSSVPALRPWAKTKPAGQPGNPMVVGKKFGTGVPKVDVPEAYVALDIPRLQIQGDKDIPGLREDFEKYCPKNDPLVRHMVVPGADHVFTTWKHRKLVIDESTRWFKKYLA